MHLRLRIVCHRDDFSMELLHADSQAGLEIAWARERGDGSCARRRFPTELPRRPVQYAVFDYVILFSVERGK